MLKRKYLTLDGMRGLAALAVVFWHAHPLDAWRLNSAYLAVDLFFLLSGFVVALAYEHRFAEGMPALEFLKVRLLRLYPLYIAGVAITAACYLTVYLAAARTGAPAPWPFGLLIRDLIAALAFVPTKAGDPAYYLFPLNQPAWSLMLELLVNLVYAVALPALTTRRLMAIVALSGFTLLACAHHYGTLDLGWNWTTLWGGVPRVTFSFFLGVLLHRWRAHLPALRFPAPLILAATCLALATPSGLFGGAGAFLVVVAVFPAIVLAAIASEPPPRLAPLFAWGGLVSYALYALHDPLLVWTTQSLKVAGIDPRRSGWIAYAAIAAIVVVAHAAAQRFDQPLRRRLGSKARALENVTASA